MCYQVVEVYSQCHCLYYQHPVDRCKVYGKAGHQLEKRMIYVGYACKEHASDSKAVESFSTSQDSAYHSGSEGQSSQAECESTLGMQIEESSEAESTSRSNQQSKIPFRWPVLTPFLGLQIPKETLEPFQFLPWTVYLCSFRQRGHSSNRQFSQLSQLFVGFDGLGDDLDLKTKHFEGVSTGGKASDFYRSDSPPPSVKLEPADNTVSSKFRVGSDQSGATKTTVVPSIFSDSASSWADVSDGLSWSEQEASDSDDQTSSTHPGDLETADFAHNLNETRASMVATLVAGFNSQTTATSESQESSSSQQDQQESSRDPKRSSAKRQEADSDDDAKSRPDGPRLAKRSRTNPEHDLLFACVYFKKDPLRYHTCGKAGQKRIRDVKQHLRRKHYDPFYCSRCFVSFSTEQQRDDHTRAQDCSLLPDQTRDQLTWEQIMSLSKKVNHRLTPAMQWFSVWDICFPGRPRPASPFIDPELSEQLSSFRDYYNSNGPDMIFAALSERNLINWSLPNEERDLAAFGRAVLSDSLDRVFATWLENQRQSSAADEPSTTDSVSDESSRLAEQAEASAATEAEVAEVAEASNFVLPMSAQMQQGFGELAYTTAGDVNALETPHLLSFPADNFFLEHMGLGSWDSNPDYNFG